jgi:competence protein ComEC
MLPVLVGGLAWLAGIFLGSLPGPADLALPTAAGALLSVALSILWWPRPRVRLAAIGLAFLLAGAARSQLALPSPGPLDIDQLANQRAVAVRGTVDGEVTQRDRWLEFPLTVEEARSGSGDWGPATGRLLVRADRWVTATYGDRLEVAGRLSIPAEGEGFSYREYLRRQGILAIIYRPKLEVAPTSEGPPDPSQAVYRQMYRLKAHLTSVLRAILPEPESSLAQGILLGNRASMPESLRQAFARTNTTHIIAISGFNISLLAGALLLLGQRTLGPRRATMPAIAGVVAYTVLVGASPSVVRAAIMGCILIVGTHLGRRGDTLVGLALAAGLMTAFQPLLLWDVGFQLSFLATAGLVAIVPRFQGWAARLPRPLGDDLATTLAAQVAVAPVLVVNFQQLSLVTVPANLLVLPTFPPIMVLGGLATALGAIWQPLGAVAGWLVWPFLAYTIRAVEFFGGLPFATVSLGPAPVALAWVYYAGLGLWLARPAKAQANPQKPSGARLDLLGWVGRFKLQVALALVAALIWAGAIYGAPPAEPRITFLDVGQGDAILIRTQEGQVALIDGGPSPSVIMDALGRRLPFWRRGIDLVILTHAHEDHLAGILEVMDRYQVGLALDASGDRTANARRLAEAAARRGVAYDIATTGQVYQLGDGVTLEVLHPPPHCSGAHPCSVVVRVVSGPVAALLTGDIDEAGQRTLLASGAPLQAQILKAPHHGAAGGLSAGLLARARPEVAVIPVGQGNRFGHPAPATLEMLAGVQTYRTDVHGDIEVIVEGTGYRIETGKRP